MATACIVALTVTSQRLCNANTKKNHLPLQEGALKHRIGAFVIVSLLGATASLVVYGV